MKYEIRVTDRFQQWIEKLKDNQAKAKLYARIKRMESGHLGDIKMPYPNLYEARLFVSKGYRIYFTIRGGEVIILICGGHKGTQQKDFIIAKKYLAELNESNE